MEFDLQTKAEVHPQRASSLTIRFNQWVLAALLVWLAHAGMVNAVGLGKLNVQSRLGQPFAAEIDLINVSKHDLATLQVSLAPPAAYQSANLRFDPVLNGLRLSVARHANGTPYIRATTLRRVTEPYLDLMVDFTSQDGRVRRAYAALLDMQDTAEPAVVAAAPAVTPPASKAEAAPPRAQRAARARPAARPSTAVARAPEAIVAAPPPPAIPAVPAAPTVAGKSAMAQPDAMPVDAAKPAPAKPEPATPEPATPEPTTPVPPQSAPAAAEAPNAALAKAESKQAEPAPVPQVDEPATKAAIVPRAPIQESFIDTLKNSGMLIGGVALALLAGIGGLWALRRREQASVETVRIAPTVGATGLGGPAATVVAAATSANVAAAATTTAIASVPVVAAAEPAEVEPPAVTVASVSDTVDLLDEAKVYLEYGQDDRAETVLREALSKQPGREDAQLLLLQILSGRGDKERFSQLAGRLHKQTGGLGGSWKRAMAMGFALDPNNPLYSPTDETAIAGALDAAPVAADFSNTADILLKSPDANMDLDKTMVLVRPTAAPAPIAVNDLPEISFELPSASASPGATVAETGPTKAASKDVPPLDFNVDFSGLAPKPEATVGAPAGEDNSLREAVQQKLDLARAYREMNDKEGALELLREVEREGDAAQQAEAQEIVKSLA